MPSISYSAMHCDGDGLETRLCVSTAAAVIAFNIIKII